MAFKTLLAIAIAYLTSVSAQSNSPYCDSTSGICYQGYTDPEMEMTIGFVLPPLTDPPSNEFIAQIVAPASYGWTGLSAGGQMAESLLFTLWPYNEEVMLGPRWASGYVLPEPYAGPTITLLPDSTVNSTHIKASFRCQNCTVWEGGSFGSGDLNSFQLIAYVASTTTPVDDPSDIASSLEEHNEFDFFGLNLTTAHDPKYSSYINGGSATSTAALSSSSAPSTSSSVPSSAPPSSTSSASGAVQTQWGQCGGTGWTGPTACASGLTCIAVSPPYYSQCQ